MIKFIIDLLIPVFQKMGVSPVDVETYVTSLSGYIYAILISLLIAIAVMFGAHWFVKRGTRHIVRWGVGISWVLLVTVLANVICYGPMYNNISIILNNQVSVSEKTAVHSKEVIEDVGDEGMVLVKNESSMLPLEADSNINVFGWASTNPIFGGTGSGSSANTDAVGIIQSLQNAGFNTNEELTQMYVDYQGTRLLPGPGEGGTDWTLSEPTVDYYTDEVMKQAKEFSDTALIVISRSGGEGMDVPSDMHSVVTGNADIRDEVADGNPNYGYFASKYTNNSEEYFDFDEGESYLELSNTEEDMIEKVCSEFDNVAVVINANNTMELGWVDQYDSIKSVILAPGTGSTGMSALGKILDGEVNPSGKTVDTYIYDLTQSPVYNNVGHFGYTNVDDLKAEILAADDAYQGVIAFVDYVEGIYMGYKFFETAAEEGVLNYEAMVQYSFGHGLSYTTFTQEMQSFKDNGDSVSFDVNVTNTGDVAGKDVVEIYYTPPYYNGGIEKASVNLLDFEKTEILEPGQSQTISFTVDKEDMASYDSKGVKTKNGGYVLEAGEYIISVRSDSHTVIAQESFNVDEDINYEEIGRSSDEVAATNQFQDYSAGTVEYLSRADGFANYATALASPAEDRYVMDDATREQISSKSTAHYDPTLYDDSEAEMPTTGADNGLKLEDFTGVDYDDASWEDLLDQLSVEEMVEMVNLGGFQTIAVKSVDKARTLDSDGPTGLNDWYVGVYGTAFPTAVMIAQTWNKELAYGVGDAMSAEYAECGIYGWYGPAMNIHRNPFNGRNFEYYSEDGVLSGKMVEQTVNAAGERGVYAYIKHFVLNDQETNRCTFLLTYCDEQALREIYLKPFEECIKDYDYSSKPLAVMSSFNFIGGIYCGANTHLLNNVLRDEWGFRGMVITDWDGSYGYQNTDDCIRNGNDLMLGFNTYESNEITDTEAASCVQALRQASKNILFTVANSGTYTVEGSESLFTPMNMLFFGIDMAVVVIGAGIMAIVLVRWKKKQSVQIIIEESKDKKVDNA